MVKIEELDEVSTILLSLLISNKHDLSLAALDQKYYQQENKHIPWRKFGYENSVAFLKSMPQHFNIYNTNGTTYVRGIASEKSVHIQSLVSRQKSKSKSRCTRGMYAPPTNSHAILNAETVAGDTSDENDIVDNTESDESAADQNEAANNRNRADANKLTVAPVRKAKTNQLQLVNNNIRSQNRFDEAALQREVRKLVQEELNRQAARRGRIGRDAARGRRPYRGYPQPAYGYFAPRHAYVRSYTRFAYPTQMDYYNHGFGYAPRHTNTYQVHISYSTQSYHCSCHCSCRHCSYRY